MSMINERQIALRGGGNYPSLKDYLDGRRVKAMPFVETQAITVVDGNVAVIDDSILSGNIALGSTSARNNGVIAVALPGTVGVGETAIVSDSFGNILNMISMRDASTHDPIMTGTGTEAREVFGLLQVSNTAVDGDVIGASGSENLQISFVKYTSNGVLELVKISATVEFQVNKLFLNREMPSIYLEGGNIAPDILTPNPVVISARKFVVTAPFANTEGLTVSTGVGTIGGASTISGDNMILHSSAADFDLDNGITVLWNGFEIEKGVDVVWSSTDTLQLNIVLDVHDVLTIKRIAQ